MTSTNTKTISNIVDILNSNLSKTEMILQTGNALKKSIPYDRFSIGLSQQRIWFHHQNEQLTCEQQYERLTEYSSASAWVHIHQTPLLRKNITLEPRFKFDNKLIEENLTSHLVLPLQVDGVKVGTFAFSNRQPETYSQEHLNFALEISNLVGLCVKQVIQKHNTETFTTFTLELQNAKKLNTLLEIVLDHLHTRFDRIRIYLYDPAKNVMNGHLQINEQGIQDLSHRSYSASTDTYTQQTLRADTPQIYSTNTESHKVWLQNLKEANILHPAGDQEWAEVALKVNPSGDEILIGKISLDNNQTQIPLEKNQLNDLMTLFRQTAIAIHQVQLHENMAALVAQRTEELLKTNQELKTKEELLSSLNQVIDLSLSYLDRDVMLDNFAKQIIRAGIFRSLMIALVDHDTQTIWVERAYQRNAIDTPSDSFTIKNVPETCGVTYKLSDNNITPITARTGELQMAETKLDTRLDARFEENTDWADKVAYFIPVKRADKVVAVLATGSRQEEKEDFLHRLQTMEPLLNQLGIALEHANLFQTAKKNEALYRSLFENMDSAFAYRQLITDANGRPEDYVFLEANKAFQELAGKTRDEIVGHRVRDIMPKVTQGTTNWIEKYGEVAQTGKPFHDELYYDNIDKWYSIAVYSPQKGYFATVSQDITKRKKSEENLRALSEFQSSLLNTPNIWISAFDSDLKVTFWNRGAELISGYSFQEIQEDDQIWQSINPEAKNLDAILQTLSKNANAEGLSQSVESRLTSKDGERKTISWYAHQLKDHTDTPLGQLVIGVDITQRKYLETEIVRLERLKALGELAAGVSHNLNNILTGILLPANMLREMPLSEPIREEIQDIYTSATRAKDLVLQLNQSVRHHAVLSPEPTHVQNAVEEAIKATRMRWKDESEAKGIKIQMNTDLQTQNQKGKATQSGLFDVLVNLILNAVDALPNGGQIEINTRIQNDTIFIDVQDNGQGMTEDVTLKVFEPFFTTKMNVGTGLGLSTAYNHVQSWGGELSVKSKFGSGTKFTIKLPIWTDQEIQHEVPHSEAIDSMHILLVEDDVLVGRALEKYLQNAHALTIAKTANEAILKAKNFDHIDVALIDLGLPDMPGDQLAPILKEQFPNLTLILMTGWFLKPNDPRIEPFHARIQKPISDPQELLNTISNASKKHARQ